MIGWLIKRIFPNNYRDTGADMGIGAKNLAFERPFSNPLYDVYGQAGFFQAVQESFDPLSGAPGAYAFDPVLANVLGYGTEFTGSFNTTPLLDLSSAQAAGAGYVHG